MQVVHTKYKKVTSLGQREFVEKKLYFCHTLDSEEVERLRNSPKAGLNKRGKRSLSDERPSAKKRATPSEAGGLAFYTYFSAC